MLSIFEKKSCNVLLNGKHSFIFQTKNNFKFLSGSAVQPKYYHQLLTGASSKLNIHRVFRRFFSAPAIDTSLVDMSEEVKRGFAEGRAIVALESTIITHGMPYPKNLETAQQVERIVRDQGAVPATIAILEGRVAVGLDPRALEALAGGSAAGKVSRRDLPLALARGADGGTTVSGTMLIAARVGINVFVTGGIGGVHRGGETSFDVSADLTELGRTPVCVVSSGVKSILDIGRTLEYLETQGVSVTTYGNSTDFPAFYTRKSGFHSPGHVTTPGEAARMIKSALDLQLGSGLLIAVPVPEEFAMEEGAIESAIQEALSRAEGLGVKGKDVTPFILAAVAEITRGRSLQTNIALIKNNAKIGSQIAVELNKIEKYPQQPQERGGLYVNDQNLRPAPGSNPRTFPRVSTVAPSALSGEVSGSMKPGAPGGGALAAITPVVIGGSNVDYTIRVLEDVVQLCHNVVTVNLFWYTYILSFIALLYYFLMKRRLGDLQIVLF